DLDDVVVTPEPLQQPHPPLWVAATAPPAAERAGRHGAHLHGAAVDPEFHAAYFRGLEAAGVDRATVRISNPWSITLTDQDPSAVWPRTERLSFDRWVFSRQIRPEMGAPALDYGRAPGPGAYRDFELIGDADTVLGTLEPLVRSLPITDIVHAGP